MNLELALTDEKARRHALAVLHDLGHRAVAAPTNSRAGPYSILVTGVAESDRSVVHAVVTSVDRAADAVVAAMTAPMAAPMRTAG